MDERKIAVTLGVTGVIVILLSLFWPTRSSREHGSSLDEKRAAKNGRITQKHEESGKSSSFSGSVGRREEGNSTSQVSGADHKPGNTAVAKIASASSPAVASFSEVSPVSEPLPGQKTVKSVVSGAPASSDDTLTTVSTSGSLSSPAGTKVNTNVRLPAGSDSGSAGSGGSAGSSGSSGNDAGGSESTPAFQSARELNSASKNETPRLAFTEEEAKVLRAKRQTVLNRIFERKQNWVASRASAGSGLSAKTQARYRLKMIEGYADGNEAMKKGNWAEAIKGFLAGVKDPDADPITKYTCFDQMRMCAKMLKDYDLYLEILKEQGRLIENDDLSILGIDKSTMGTRFYETRRQFVQAIKDPVNGFKKSIDEIMQAKNLKEEDREATEERFKQDLADWQADFDKTT